MTHNPHITPGPTIVSPTKRLIEIALRVIDRALRDGICPLCGRAGGEHGPSCLVGESLVHDPLVRRQAMGNRG